MLSLTPRRLVFGAVLIAALFCATAPDGAGGLTVLAPELALALQGPESTTGLIVQGLEVQQRNAERMDEFTKLLLSGESPLRGKRVLITGASRGLGAGIAVWAAAAGADLILPVRKMSEAERVRKQLEADTAQLGKKVDARGVTFFQLDLASFESIEGLMAALVDKRVQLDILINNAGLVPINAGTTKEGFELSLGVNHIGTVYLTEGLAAAGVIPIGRSPAPRVVMVGSEEHRHGVLNESGAPFGVPKKLSMTEAVNPIPRYSASKLALLSYSYELARRWAGKAVVYDICPGPVVSEIARDAPWPFNLLTKWWMEKIFRSAQEAALPVLWLASHPEAAQSQSVHYHMSEPRQGGAGASDPSQGKWVYDATLAMIKQRGPPSP
eukprot:Hpha_TRINITY_DN6419_c0_g1::TRINITY_DN6419_c0_g1_i1::g.261::m.261